jgi:hypothetical protein
MTPMELVRELRKAAQEIADEGHNGWGNLCSLAADEIERLQDEREIAATSTTTKGR